MNQTKHCWQNYVDYHKCILAKGEDFILYAILDFIVDNYVPVLEAIGDEV